MILDNAIPAFGPEQSTSSRTPTPFWSRTPTPFWAGFSEDLSEGGLFVATYQAMPIGTRMDLQFELPTGHVVKVAGTVRWHRGQSDDAMPGMGISFDELSPADLKVVRSFVKHRPPLLWDVD